MKIDIDDECLDYLIGCVLIDCHVNSKKRLKEFEKKKKLTKFEKEDLENFKNLLPALDVVGAWFVYDWVRKTEQGKEK